MTNLSPDPRTENPAESDDAVSEHPDWVALVRQTLSAGQTQRVHAIVDKLHYADVADLIEELSSEDRVALIGIMGTDLNPEVLPMLDDDVRDEVAALMGPREVAAAIGELDSDDAVEVVQTLEEPLREEVLEAVSAEERAVLEQGLTFPEDSAGRLMQRELVSVPAGWTVGDTIDHLRDVAERDDEDLPYEFYDIFVVDEDHRLMGSVSLSRVLRSKRPVPMRDLMNTQLRSVPVTMDQEEVAVLFRQYDLASVPVIDDGGRLLGVITVDDVVDIIHEEAEEDILRLGGVTETDLYRAAIDTAQSRFPWLATNLATAFIAAYVIGLFQATIEQVVALAVLMPIVASMGGNAGTQTMTVAVRAIATKELTVGNALRIIWKEALVGGVNGVLFAVMVGLAAWWWFGNPSIGLVIASAMVINLMVAGLAGVTIPLILTRCGVDPAIASSVFLTTMTDVVGFFAFLGLATIFVI